jgi:hypothetical protein
VGEGKRRYCYQGEDSGDATSGVRTAKSSGLMSGI